jgi:hypothetical protein
MLYDIGNNTFDLFISISGFTNALSASHIHEAVAGTNGSVVVPFSLNNFAANAGTLSGTVHAVERFFCDGHYDTNTAICTHCTSGWRCAEG